MTTFTGFLHVRGTYQGLLFLFAICAITIFFPTLSIGVSFQPGLPPRGVGMPEICAVVAASCLPAISRPRSNNEERYSAASRRAIHALYTGIVVLAPALPSITWYLRLKPDYQLPSISGLLGTPIFLCALAVIALHFCGPVISVITPPVLFAAIVTTQHIFPSGVTATIFTTAEDWHTCWPLVAIATGLAIITAYMYGSTPRK